jgi:bifunctional non-homologous end joining protein LigD
MKKKPLIVGGKELALSNLEKVMYPHTGFTKGQVIDYYTGIARYILPHPKKSSHYFKTFPERRQRAVFLRKGRAFVYATLGKNILCPAHK